MLVYSTHVYFIFRNSHKSHKRSIMFYEEQQIDEMLKCGHCKLKFDDPRMLPCGQTICNSCLETILASVKKENNCFKCPLCKEIHKSGEFPVNELGIHHFWDIQKHRETMIKQIDDYEAKTIATIQIDKKAKGEFLGTILNL